MNKQHVANGRKAREHRQMVATDAQNGREVWQPDPVYQIGQLDARLGKGVGATKERARLAKQIAKMSDAKPPKKGKKK